MANLQKVNLGAIPDGAGGDDARTGFNRGNTNVDVLSTQLALVSNAAGTITNAQALTNAHVGKRVNINLTSAGTINLPSAATCAADQVIHLRNTGGTVITLAITTGSGDTIALSQLNPGESALMDTDGVHAWNVITRGRSNSDNEVVNGTLYVNGAGGVQVYNGVAALGQVSAGSILSSGNVGLTYATPATQRAITWSTGGKARWFLQNDGSAEAGSNAGSNLVLSAFSDTGAFLGNWLTVSRATASVSIPGATRVGTAASVDGAVLFASNNQSAVGSTPAASFSSGTATGPRLWVIPNTGAAYFNPIVGANDVLLLPNNGGNSGVNLSICPPGSTAGGMRLTADGNVSFGVVNIGGLYNGTATADGTGFGVDHGFYIQRKAGAGIWVSKNGSVAGTWDPAYIQFYNQGTQIGSISTPAGSSISYNTTSDYRIKTVVRLASGVLDRVCAIPVYRGYYTADGAGSEHEIALAHEIAKQFPAVVSGEKDAVSIHPVFREDYDPNDVKPEDVTGLAEAIVPQQVDYSRLVVPLFAAVQELRALLDAANDRISDMENKR